MNDEATTDETQQSVADNANASSQTDAAANGAQGEGGDGAAQPDDLDALLKQYDTAGTQASPGDTGQGTQDGQTQSGQSGPETDKLVRRIDDLEQRERLRLDRLDMAGLVTTVRGDIDIPMVDDIFVEAYINAEAARDPRLAKAWANRDTDPAGFKRIAGGLGTKFAKGFDDLPDKRATEDRAAVSAAVRGASRKGSQSDDEIDTEKVANMTDSEFEKFARAEQKKVNRQASQ